ncbi:MAG TPA: hypothetical protein VF069_03050 [Streptosporangiaceae bacterium]
MPDDAPRGSDGPPRPARRVTTRHFGRRMLLAMALVILLGFALGLLLPVSK